MTSCVWGYFFCEQMNERRTYVIVSQRGYFTTSKEHEISVCEPPSVSSSLCFHLCFSFTLSWVCIFFTPSHLSPLWSESLPFSPSFLPSLLSSLLPSLLPSYRPGGRRDLNFEQKTQGGKLCRNIWSVFPPSLFWEMSSTPKEQFSKEAESSWLKPDNAHGSL